MKEEHAEYIRSMATLSAFMAGFVNIAFVQFDFTAAEIPYNVLLGFGITNAVTVSLIGSAEPECTTGSGTVKSFLSGKSSVSEE